VLRRKKKWYLFFDCLEGEARITKQEIHSKRKKEKERERKRPRIT
jgi:hypothetical protein